MPPKFSLQTVLDVRHSKVDALELDLSRLLVELQEAQQRHELLTSRRSSLYQQLIAQMNGEFDLFLVNSLRSELDLVAKSIRAAEEVIAGTLDRIARKQEEIVAAKQAEKVLDTLKDKETERYQSELAQRELRQQDDIYIAQAFRQRSGGF